MLPFRWQCSLNHGACAGGVFWFQLIASASKVVGADKTTMSEPTMAAEDFSYFLNEVLALASLQRAAIVGQYSYMSRQIQSLLWSHCSALVASFCWDLPLLRIW